MNFQVLVTTGARDDVRAILGWLSHRSLAGAEAWLRRWEDILREIAMRAESFGEAAESVGHREPVRQAIFKTRRGRPYRALFVVRAEALYILHVRGTGQDTLPRSELRTP